MMSMEIVQQLLWLRQFLGSYAAS